MNEGENACRVKFSNEAELPNPLRRQLEPCLHALSRPSYYLYSVTEEVSEIINSSCMQSNLKKRDII